MCAGRFVEKFLGRCGLRLCRSLVILLLSGWHLIFGHSFRSGCLLGDERGWFANVGDYDFAAMGGLDTFRKLKIADVKRIPLIEFGNISQELVRQIPGKADDLDGMMVLLQNAAFFHTLGLASEVDWDIRSDLGLVIHCKEIHVQRVTGQRIVLDGFEENGAHTFALDIEVDQDAIRGAVREKLGEGFRIDLEVLVRYSTSVNHGWEPAFTAHLLEFPGTAAEARCCFECRRLGHVKKRLVVDLRSLRQGGFLNPGGRSVNTIPPLVKKLFAISKQNHVISRTPANSNQDFIRAYRHRPRQIQRLP